MENTLRSKISSPANLANMSVCAKEVCSNEKQLAQAISDSTLSGNKAADMANVSEACSKALASIATNAWKAKTRLNGALSNPEEGILKRVTSDIDRIWNVLIDDLGLEIKDYTGADFDYGMALRVVTSQPMPNIRKERVIETIKPTILWGKKIIQMGEVVIATPS